MSVVVFYERGGFSSRECFLFFNFFTDTSKAEIKLFTSKISFNAMELFYICVGIGAASWRAEFCYEVKYWYFDYSCRFTMASLFVMFRITWHFIDPDCARACYKLDIGGHVKRELPSSNRSEISELKTSFLVQRCTWIIDRLGLAKENTLNVNCTSLEGLGTYRVGQSQRSFWPHY